MSDEKGAERIADPDDVMSQFADERRQLRLRLRQAGGVRLKMNPVDVVVYDALCRAQSEHDHLKFLQAVGATGDVPNAERELASALRYLVKAKLQQEKT